MKTINRLFAAALVLFVAAACYNKEIESPDNRQDPETQDISEQTGLKITASIIQTRVIYNDNDNDLSNKLLEQVWEVGDILFGFIDNASQTPVEFQVYKVINGIATLVPTTGGDALSVMDENTYVNLIYTGGNPLTLSENSYTVDMSSQSGKIPACMHASAKKSNDALEFHFVNDCAIFEIVSLTGVAEDHSSESQGLKSITVSNVFTSGKYTFGGNGSVSFDGVSGEVDDVTITLGDGWIIDDSGTIKNDGAAQPVLIAVAPKTADITITAEADNNIHYGYDFGSKSIVAKKCYVVSAKPVVARTSDGQYFTSVSGAFDHAAELFSANKYDSEHNIVTLVKGCSFGDDDINIDGYDVILDLNGKTLSQDGEGMFYVQYNGNNGASNNPSSFTIRDSKVSGKIDGQNDNWIVDNYGVLNIEGGSLNAIGETQTIFNEASGKLTITDGDFTCISYPTIDNRGEAIISGGTFSIDEEGDFEVISNNGKLTINDGTITSSPIGNAIINTANGKLYITGGTISSTNQYALYTAGTVNISGGTISSTNNFAVYAVGGTVNISQAAGKTCEISCNSSSSGTMMLLNAGGTISGGTIKSSGKSTIYLANETAKDATPVNNELVVSGGNIICMGTGAAIECDANNTGRGIPKLTIQWPGNNTNSWDYTKVEPLLYSESYVPISEESSNPDNDACEVTIKGGFLCTGVSDGAFFQQNETPTDNYKPLKPNNAEYCFYSNVANAKQTNYTESVSYVSINEVLDIYIPFNLDTESNGIPAEIGSLSITHKFSISSK